MKAWRSVAGVGLAALLGLASVTLAEAAVTRTPYQRYINGNCASNSLTCTIDFPLIPANHRLELTNASCYMRQRDLGTGSVYALQLLTIKSNGALVSAVTLVPQLIAAINNANRIYSSNDPVTAFAAAGQRFQALVQIQGVGDIQQFACGINGSLLKLS